MTTTQPETSGASDVNTLEGQVRQLLERKDRLNQLLTTTAAQKTQVQGEMKAATQALRAEYDRIGLELEAKRKPFCETINQLDRIERETHQSIHRATQEISTLNARLAFAQIQLGGRGIETRDDVRALLKSIGVVFSAYSDSATVDDRILTLANGVRIFRVTSGWHGQNVLSLAVKGNQVVGIQKTRRSLHRGDSSVYSAWVDGPIFANETKLSWGMGHDRRSELATRYGLDYPRIGSYRNDGFSFKEWLAVLKQKTVFVAFNLSDESVKTTIVGWLS